jgi:hypothetical protein
MEMIDGMAENGCLKGLGIIIALNVGARGGKSMPLLTNVDNHSAHSGSQGADAFAQSAATTRPA